MTPTESRSALSHFNKNYLSMQLFFIIFAYSYLFDRSTYDASQLFLSLIVCILSKELFHVLFLISSFQNILFYPIFTSFPFFHGSSYLFIKPFYHKIAFSFLK